MGVKVRETCRDGVGGKTLVIAFVRAWGDRNVGIAGGARWRAGWWGGWGDAWFGCVDRGRVLQ